MVSMNLSTMPMVLCAADSVLTEKVVSGLIVTVVSLQTEFAVVVG